MKITGEITKKEIKEGATAGKDWKRCSYTIGNTAYSTFDTKYMDFAEKNIVNIEYVQEGNFFNIKSMELASLEMEGSPEDITRKAVAAASSTAKGKKFIVTVEELQ